MAVLMPFLLFMAQLKKCYFESWCIQTDLLFQVQLPEDVAFAEIPIVAAIARARNSELGQFLVGGLFFVDFLAW